MRKPLAAAAAALIAVALQASTALACGGLVAPNGSVRLARATTLVAWHDGVEHYLTSFSYQGDVAGLGWIVPLPAVPTSIQEGGAWTLQRLEREVNPQPRFAEAAAGAAAPSAQVLETVQVEALDITILKGSGDAILQWCRDNGFVIPLDTEQHLLVYAQASPIFMAAKYDVHRAQARHQLAGDGAPVLITMRTPHLWVPLEVLANDNDPVDADLFLLTDSPLTTGQESVFDPFVEGRDLPGAPGFTLTREEQLNAPLQHDLSTDRNMSWVPQHGWLTYLTLRSTGEDVTYDLAVGDSGRIRLAPFGTRPDAAATAEPTGPFTPSGAWSTFAFLALLPLVGGLVVALVLRRRTAAVRLTTP